MGGRFHLCSNTRSQHSLLIRSLRSLDRRGHRKYDCPEQRNFTINLQCRICGNAGHMARDCMYKNDPEMLRGLAEKNKEMDSEIGKFMEELGGGQGGPGADGIEPSVGYLKDASFVGRWTDILLVSPRSF